MSDNIPGPFKNAHRALKLESEEDQGNLIRLLMKYSLPAIEKARAKRKWTRKQELINFAIVEFYGKDHHLYGKETLLWQAELIAACVPERWPEGTPQIYTILVKDMAQNMKDFQQNYYAYWAKTLTLYQLDDQGRSLVSDDMAEAKKRQSNNADQILKEVFFGASGVLLKQKENLMMQKKKRARLDTEDEEETMEDRMAKLERIVTELQGKLAELKK